MGRTTEKMTKETENSSTEQIEQEDVSEAKIKEMLQLEEKIRKEQDDSRERDQSAEDNTQTDSSSSLIERIPVFRSGNENIQRGQILYVTSAASHRELELTITTNEGEVTTEVTDPTKVGSDSLRKDFISGQGEYPEA